MNEDISTNMHMKIDSTESIFYFENSEVKTPIGFDLIANEFFTHILVRSDEIEYAINYIEDEIEKIVPLLPKVSIIKSSERFLFDIALLCGEKKKDIIELSKNKIEYLFGMYAEVAQGAVPQAFQTDLSPLFYAKILIVREYMHHLKFDILKIYNSNNL